MIDISEYSPQGGVQVNTLKVLERIQEVETSKMGGDALKGGGWGKESEHILRGLTKSRRQATLLSQVPITLECSSIGMAQVKMFTPRSWKLKKGCNVMKMGCAT